jgi:SAM-dependent methyltransferase
MLKNIHFNIIDDRNLCPVCDSELPTFIPGGVNGRENAMCPKCGSLERNRAAYLFLKEETNIFDENIKMLHFAPERVLSEIFRKKENIDYLPVDLNPNMHDVKEKMDIQDIKYPDNTFDFIYCSHVLEHVPNDKKAMKELYRVLKPNGKAIIQVPLNPNYEETYEDPSFNTPELRLKHYGQSDHVRYYGLDFQKKLENAGFKASNEYVGSMDEKSLKKYGFKNDNLFYCTK